MAEPCFRQGQSDLFFSRAVADLRGGARDARPPGLKFLHFHAVFGKNWPNNRLAPPPFGVSAPSSGKSWIRHWRGRGKSCALRKHNACKLAATWGYCTLLRISVLLTVNRKIRAKGRGGRGKKPKAAERRPGFWIHKVTNVLQRCKPAFF